jgi:metal-responsive CopG/Arc/MetJ family transcriptional regulator
MMVIVMRTTISIDEELMNELMRVEKGATRSEAVRRAIMEHVHQRRVDEFMKLAGSKLVDLDWREAERIEMEDAERLHRKRDEAEPRQGKRHARAR